MKIGMLGSGEVGRVLGRSLVGLGHQVVMGSRTPGGRAAEWAAGLGPNASTATPGEVAREGELLINALRGAASLEVIGSFPAADVAGKILIDIANNFGFSGSVPTVDMPQTDSLAERLQRAAPGLRVVKALNTMNVRVMVAPASLAGPHDLMLCGDDAAARAAVAGYLRDWFGWASVVDLGPLEAARGLEAYLGLWLRLRLTLGTSLFNIHVARQRGEAASA